MPALVTQPEAIDAAWLTQALREAGLLPEGRVVDVRWKLIGAGKMGDNVRYELAFEGAPEGLPGSLVAKLPAADPTARVAAAMQGLYWREVEFYREFAPRIPVRTPRVHYSDISADRKDFVILMEDLRPAETGDQVEGCSAEVAALALREAARLHGPLFGDPVVASAEWITQRSEAGAQLGATVLQQMWPGFVERFADCMTPEMIALGARYAERFAAWAASEPPRTTLIHADYRLENLLFGRADGEATVAVVDWQSVGNGSAFSDVAYFVGGGMLVEERRAHERELVEQYRGELAGFGVELEAEDCWQQYRRGALHGIIITVLGAMMSSADPRGDRMFAAMISRHLQHGLDLGSAEFLD